jgi:lipoate-protein ligase A
MKPFSEHWFLLNSGPCDAAFNMALDQALMEHATQLGAPVLRFYGWTLPAASFGYFQRYADIEAATHLRPLVRRPTGGGLVPHDADWTYSLAFPAVHEWYSLAAAESYRRVHEWVCNAFRKLGVDATLAPCCRNSGSGRCFAGYEESDVLWQGGKIAGAAQRRSRTGLLIQGSVQPPSPGPAKADWQAAMCVVAIGRWCAGWSELAVEGALLARVEELEESKYARADYNHKR